MVTVSATMRTGTKLDVDVGDKVLVVGISSGKFAIADVIYRHKDNRWFTVMMPKGYREGYRLYAQEYIGLVVSDTQVLTRLGIVDILEIMNMRESDAMSKYSRDIEVKRKLEA